MNPVAGAYAQRILLTVFLASFGIYLLIATVTYTPFDPGWTHVSSDTQQVTNASGVAGAWIADLLYGVFGHAALLLPIFILAEAIQLWWPHSFLSRPFRIAAEIFILTIVAALLSLHFLQPTDTLSNASGGIIGYEIGRNLLALVGMIIATIFLVALLLTMLTMAFGIRWNKTMDTLGKIPALLQELFYKNVPAREAAPDLTLGEKLELEHSAADHAAHSIADSNDASDADLGAEQAVIQSGQRWSAHAKSATPVESETIIPVAATGSNPPMSTLDHLAALVQKADHVLAETNTPIGISTNEATAQTLNTQIEPSFAWQDQSVFDELLAEAPAQTRSDASTDTTLSSVPSTDTASNPSYAAASDSNPSDAFERTLNIFEQSLNPLPDHMTSPSVSPTPQSVAPVNVIPVAAKQLIPPVVQKTPVTTTEVSVDDLIQEFGQSAAEQQAALADDEFDAPLTDASGRPMSRSMQVIQRRANLSPLPGLDLLDLPDPSRKVSYTAEQLERLSKLLEIKLQEFNVKAKVVEAQPGPVVTRFELELAPGVKASKVTNISRDLARSMSMASVRVVEVIPGKPYIGIEVPNTSREMVRLSELLQTDAYRDPTGLITMAMGKDIAGRPVLTDLAKAPHMLVAGTTGSGKSVAVNAMLLSMLLKYTPQQLRLILIDPKQLELANYGDIPHLLTPVVTDMKDAVNALNWAVNEMERRYKLMTFLKVRKIDEFNRKVNEAIARGEDLLDPTWKPQDSAVQDRAPRLQALPLIVIVADEFADMIMQVGKKAEELITRLAQKSRAAGIHLMLATQRPSVDVITGLIKANIPTRVALRVNSKIDSRTILDGGGAEDLLGHGDMLFLAPGKIEPERVHGAFISDDEVNRICDAWRERASPDYIDEILTPYDDDGSSRGFESEEGGSDRDAMYDQAVQFVLETRKCSASALQRKFSLGYNRAARLIDQMEDAGIISAMGPSGKREILV